MSFELLVQNKKETTKKLVTMEIVGDYVLIKIDEDAIARFYEDGKCEMFDYTKTKWIKGVWDRSKI